MYCNFYSIPNLKLREDYLKSLLKEIHLRKDYLSTEKISTIYIGGGSPSLLTFQELDSIFEELNCAFSINTTAEITLEANPEHLDENYLYNLKQMGWINRLSIGVQSFFDNDLKLLNRKHSGLQSINSILKAQEVGFNNISMDLIYGIPSLSDSDWIINLQKSAELNIQHLSCYALTVEADTMLDKMIRKKIIPPVYEEKCARQFEILLEYIYQCGFIQYEISNFCKPGFESKHNSNYWNNTKYAGFGASAHSYNGISRQWNVSDVTHYIATIEKEKIPFEIETLSPNDQYNEYIMTSLRTNKGISKKQIQTIFPQNYIKLSKSISKYININLILETPDSFILTNKGKLFADKVASDLFL